MSSKSKSKPIFISHAEKNKEIANILVDLFETGVGVNSDQIFCSSLEGMGIPSGVDFVEFIKSQIEEPKIVIILLTKEYFSSHFCLCELGASWALSHKTIPLLLKPLGYSDVKAVLTPKQLLKIIDTDDLNQMRDEMIEILGIKGKSFSRWEVKRKKFLKELDDVLKKYEPSFSVSVKEYNELQQKYDEALDEFESCEKQIDILKETIDQLRKAKDKKEGDSILLAQMDETEQFNELVEKANQAMSSLPWVVKECLYYHFREDSLDPTGFGKNELRDVLKEADEEDYIEYDEEYVDLIEDNPEIEKALWRLRELDNFICHIEEEENDFETVYKSKYGHRLKFRSRKFWSEHLF